MNAFFSNQYRWFIYIVISFLLGSCKKFIALPPAANSITTAAVFADSVDATAGILGLYIQALSSPSGKFFYGTTTVTAGLSGDELYASSPSDDDKQFYLNNVSPSTNNTDGTLWSVGYSLIYQANACIEGIAASQGLRQGLKDELTGEARLFRALCYFYLVNLYGPVPMVTSTNYVVNATIARASVDSVYTLIQSDALAATSLLSDSYPGPGRTRPDTYAAFAFLARIYCCRGEWAAAEDAAGKVIAHTDYALEPDLTSVFLSGSQEAIWQLPPSKSGYETADGVTFIPSKKTVFPRYIISKALWGDFETNDGRRSSWLDSNLVSGKAYYYPAKYKLGRDGLSTPVEFYMIFRLAEQYLIRAEARAQENKLSDAVADLNVVRSRAGLTGLSLSVQADVLSAVYKERRIELFCEGGSRWFDLKRTNVIDSVMAAYAPSKGTTWSSYKQLLPIPIAQLQYNPFLQQNPGYTE